MMQDTGTTTQATLLSQQGEIQKLVRSLELELRVLIFGEPPSKGPDREVKPRIANMLDELMEQQRESIADLLAIHKFIGSEIVGRI